MIFHSNFRNFEITTAVLLLKFDEILCRKSEKHKMKVSMKLCSEVRSAENEYENGNSKKENGYDTKKNILRKIILPNFGRLK